MNEDIKQMIEKYPFLTGINYADKEIVGIVQNHNAHITSIYCYDLIKDDELKKKFLGVGDTWWWESNRITPINLFLPHERIIDFNLPLYSKYTDDVSNFQDTAHLSRKGAEIFSQEFASQIDSLL